MKRIILLTLLTTIACPYLRGDNVVSQPTFGVQSVTSDYLENRYLYTDLVHYLDQQSLFVTYQSETTGGFSTPERLIFSVEGSSFRWNKYYRNGFRIDSRYDAGSTLYYPNMSIYDLSIDYLDAKLSFDSSLSRRESASVSYNVGGVGGTSVGTSEFIRLLHATAEDRALVPIDLRSHFKGAGSADVNFSISSAGRDYMQSISMDVGQRLLVDFDNQGISGYYPEWYGKIQLGGELPLTFGGLFDHSEYIAIYSQRDHAGSEFYMSEAESYNLDSYSASLYGVKRGKVMEYTSGFTIAVNNTEHEDINYSRNVIDQDGEALEPWSPDGSTLEFSHALNLTRSINSWLNLSFDSYNSLMHFAPTYQSFSNATYYQFINDENPTNLYLYEWESQRFTSGLLENSLALNFHHKLHEKIDLRGSASLTLDGMILEGSTKISPNFEARIGFDFKPTKWLDVELNLARERVSYNMDDVRYLSNDYLTGEVYYLNEDGSKGGLFTSAGGGYNTLSSDARQPHYYVVDIPVHLTFGRHTISLLHSYRKYCNLWTTNFVGDASEYGYYELREVSEGNFVDVYFLNGGENIYYEVGNYPEGIMGDNPFTSTPFYFCSNLQYSYTSPKFLFSLNWQSYMVSGISTLGNGPLHNNLGALSQSSANPNTYMVINNSNSDYSAVGRLDQDRAFVARIFASYIINDNWSLAVNAQFVDGQPFSIYHAETTSNGSSNQIAMLPVSSRGTNTADGDFGTREDAIYNIDLRVKYQTAIKGRRCEFTLQCYNAYDFGNELTEYVFDQDLDKGRCAMSLTIPRGFLFNFKIDL